MVALLRYEEVLATHMQSFQGTNNTMVAQQQSSFRELWALPVVVKIRIPLNLSATRKQPRSIPLLLVTSAVPLPRSYTVLPLPCINHSPMQRRDIIFKSLTNLLYLHISHFCSPL
jgi:hypothetical protein